MWVPLLASTIWFSLACAPKVQTELGGKAIGKADAQPQEATSHDAPAMATVSEVATAVSAAFSTGDVAKLERFIARRTIRVTRICGVCGEEDDGDATRTVDLAGFVEIVAHVHSVTQSFYEGGDGPAFDGFEKLECSSDCCERGGGQGYITHSSVKLVRVCTTVEDSKRMLTIVELLDG